MSESTPSYQPAASPKEQEKRHAEVLKELHNSSARISGLENRVGQLQDNLSQKIGELSAKTNAYGKQYEQDLKALKKEYGQRIGNLKEKIREVREEQRKELSQLQSAQEQKFALLDKKLNVGLGAIILLLILLHFL
jgi:conjugal transfer/entry exclusion protein